MIFFASNLQFSLSLGNIGESRGTQLADAAAHLCSSTMAERSVQTFLWRHRKDLCEDL